MADDAPREERVRARAAVQAIIDRYRKLAELVPGNGPEVRSRHHRWT